MAYFVYDNEEFSESDNNPDMMKSRPCLHEFIVTLSAARSQILFTQSPFNITIWHVMYNVIEIMAMHIVVASISFSSHRLNDIQYSI